MDWIKIIHILCVMGWMTSIFAVPRALIYWKRDFAKTGDALSPLGVLVKLGLVALLVIHYMMTGGMVVRAKKGVFKESDFYLRMFNEISVIGVIAILWVVVTKPF